MALRLYLDVCCYNRPFDDQTQDRIRLEAEAILSILMRCQNNDMTLVGSDIVVMELAKMPVGDKKQKVSLLYEMHSDSVSFNSDIEQRANDFMKHGMVLFDSLHLACAEYANVDVMLTTDDKLAKVSKKCGCQINVCNPVHWLMEGKND